MVTRLVVAADPDSQSAKACRARELAIPWSPNRCSSRFSTAAPCTASRSVIRESTQSGLDKNPTEGVPVACPIT
jgi:hypothetical protein